VFRGELQSAARHHREGPDFTDHSDNPRGAQPFLHRPQDLGIARRPDQHDPPGIEPVGGEAGPVKVRTRQAPQHQVVTRCHQLSEDAGDKGGGEGAILLVAAYPEDLMQGAPREPAVR